MMLGRKSFLLNRMRFQNNGPCALMAVNNRDTKLRMNIHNHELEVEISNGTVYHKYIRENNSFTIPGSWLQLNFIHQYLQIELNHNGNIEYSKTFFTGIPHSRFSGNNLVLSDIESVNISKIEYKVEQDASWYTLCENCEYEKIHQIENQHIQLSRREFLKIKKTNCIIDLLCNLLQFEADEGALMAFNARSGARNNADYAVFLKFLRTRVSLGIYNETTSHEYEWPHPFPDAKSSSMKVFFRNKNIHLESMNDGDIGYFPEMFTDIDLFNDNNVVLNEFRISKITKMKYSVEGKKPLYPVCENVNEPDRTDSYVKPARITTDHPPSQNGTNSSTGNNYTRGYIDNVSTDIRAQHMVLFIGIPIVFILLVVVIILLCNWIERPPQSPLQPDMACQSPVSQDFINLEEAIDSSFDTSVLNGWPRTGMICSWRLDDEVYNHEPVRGGALAQLNVENDSQDFSIA